MFIFSVEGVPGYQLYIYDNAVEYAEEEPNDIKKLFAEGKLTNEGVFIRFFSSAK